MAKRKHSYNLRTSKRLKPNGKDTAQTSSSTLFSQSKPPNEDLAAPTKHESSEINWLPADEDEDLDLDDLKAPTKPTDIRLLTASSPSLDDDEQTCPPAYKRVLASLDEIEHRCRHYCIYSPLSTLPDGTLSPEPKNIANINKALEIPKPSPSPLQEAHGVFHAKGSNASRCDILCHVVPLLIDGQDIQNSSNCSFTNLTSITEGAVDNPTPDFFDGAHPDLVEKQVRKDLREIIIPSEKVGFPIATNFFLLLSRDGEPAKAAPLESKVNGAYGARMMHALRNYGKGEGEEPVYDGNAYTYSATLYAGFLSLFAHHMTAPTKPGGRPGYHATHLSSYALHNGKDNPEGIAAFRILRERAKEDRERSIEIANATAQRHKRENEGKEDEGAPASRSKPISASSDKFGQECIDCKIYYPRYIFPDGTRSPKPTNIEDIKRALGRSRCSLSPSGVLEIEHEDTPEIKYEKFLEKLTDASETDMIRNVVPFIAGYTRILSSSNRPFDNLASITGGATDNPTPNLFDGAHPDLVEKQVREDLNDIIMPSEGSGIPIAPNFSLELSNDKSSLERIRWKTISNGAYWARAMNALQNYGKGEGEHVYDGNAYAYSATLYAGFLSLYAHHMTAPTEPGGRPGYHATHLNSYALYDIKAYLEGIVAFRNLREMAECDRDCFIKIANARARSHKRENEGKKGRSTE